MGIEEKWHSRTVERINVEQFEWDAVHALLEKIKKLDHWMMLGEGVTGPPCKISRKEIKDLLKTYNIPFDKKAKFEHSFIITDVPDKPGELKVGALSRAKRENEGIEGHGGFGVARIMQYEDGSRDIVKITGENAAINNEVAMLQAMHGKDKISVFARTKDDPERDGYWSWIRNSEIATKKYIIQPVAAGKELFDRLNEERMLRRNPRHAVDVALAAARAIEIVHEKNIIHRDIKPENLMITRDESQEFLITAIDFGLSIQLVPGEKVYQSKGISGTPEYMAPEIFSHRQYSKSSDIYALGVILRDDLHLFTPDINAMLRDDPRYRPNIDQVITSLIKLKDELSVNGYLDKYNHEKSKKQSSIFKKYRIKTPEQLKMIADLKDIIDPENKYSLDEQADKILAVLGGNQQRHDQALLATASSFNYIVIKSLPLELHYKCIEKLGLDRKQDFFYLKPTRDNRQKLAGYLRDYNKLNSQASQPQTVVAYRGPGA